MVFNYDGDFYALEDRCSHEDFELSAGSFDGEEATIECVLHGSKFDVRDGRALNAPAYTPVVASSRSRSKTARSGPATTADHASPSIRDRCIGH